jgi:hypothetical protein
MIRAARADPRMIEGNPDMAQALELMDSQQATPIVEVTLAIGFGPVTCTCHLVETATGNAAAGDQRVDDARAPARGCALAISRFKGRLAPIQIRHRRLDRPRTLCPA